MGAAPLAPAGRLLGLTTPPPPRKRHPLRLLAVLLVVGLVSAVAVGAGRVVWQAASTSPLSPSWLSPLWAPSAAAPPTSSSGARSGLVDLSALAARVDPALVDINTQLGYQNVDGAGTGIVLSSSGEVLTNNHVISGATSISVTDVGNGQTYPARVVGYDRSHDIAVLQLHGASGLQSASIGNSGRVAVGDEIAAIGNAGGLGGIPSIAAGTVSSLDQTVTVSDDTAGSVQQLAGLIQFAAQVQPGDSGGPLVNTAGQVVGVDTAGSTGLMSQSMGGEGLAIPINEAIATSKQIDAGIASATVHIGATGILGIAVQGPAVQAGWGEPFGSRYGSVVSGAVVAGVMPGSPGEQSGLSAGDVIVSLDGAAVDSPTTLTTLLSGHHPGDPVRLAWVDPSGQQQQATVRLAAGPPS
ncbi:MAG TPA: trypsin-like peptidase domain-containing protein [Pseudonocardiaceae bacterium]|nr:trypsin-like peptidase domain-containing protein [Pseudonocardiaceae bacterium]